ncbi:uncharacterized protein EI97DRAFT_367792 [Westerdykella ornata]|uniref:CAP-Gly domain-containing protein n=1 Tax=Westerdykella ornata TaxID=318751 RepID=A0A6A6JXB0_WESOR|nr:uncharacterized protein EI97DRAFT_367792 [Westerdykella ornata]KAF2281260.1 hypothetical protein EI97DRAFT_367792 [Westerdykella ornata]
MGGDGQEIEVGDLVDVPGGMHGTVKFIGSVRGKKGVFAGVELSREFAARGKNDGDVDGTQYFTTSTPGSGIFLPIHRARKRSSMSSEGYSPTPTTPSYRNNFSVSTTDKPNYSPADTPSMPRFAQSVGPGARAPSPTFKPTSRPSIPRPESPYRKPSLAPTPGRNTGRATPSGLSKSMVGPPRYTSPAPKGPSFQKPRTPGPPRPYSRNNSRLGHHDTIDEDGEIAPLATARGSNGSLSPSKSRRTTSNSAEEEIERLKKLLEERDKQLSAQAASLADMEAGLAEIQNLMPDESGRSRGSIDEPADVAQLRALLREKNEKIAMLTAEFDNHRADFRNTIDTLEMASTETERVYERKLEELQNELRELHERSEDVESVAIQLKQLEELVQELEEGLEDARRGEAEARGEVEFLRGEVERGRSELRREREKAAAALEGAGAMVNGPMSPGLREVEQRDDEIRGLKAIIHSLSSGPEDRGRSPMHLGGPAVDLEELKAVRAQVERLERDKEELRGLVERKAYREEELEREIEKLRKQLGEQRESIISNGMSERTIIADNHPSERDSKGTIVSWRGSPQAKRSDARSALEPMMESDAHSSADGSVLWCEICETGGHDILNCSAMGSDAAIRSQPPGKRMGKEAVIEGLRNLSINSDRSRPPTLTPTKSPGNAPSAPPPPPFNLKASPNSQGNSGLVPPKGGAVADPDKWCALCESEGHDVTACPNEDAF